MEKSQSGRNKMQKQPREPAAHQEKMGRGERHYKMRKAIQGGDKQSNKA